MYGETSLRLCRYGLCTGKFQELGVMTNISSTRATDPGRSSSSTSGDSTHVVKRGESLSRIAQQHGVGLDELVRANPQIRNPNLIHAGQHITIPGREAAPAEAAPAAQPAAHGAAPTEATPAGAREYQVKPGDTLSHIAKDHRVTLNQLLEANPQIRNPNRIRPGDTIQLPEGAREPAPSGARSPVRNGGVDPRSTRPELAAVDGTLARGASGEAVREAQQRLSDLGYRTGAVDGDFGPITQGAVRDFQTANGLETTGAIDAATRERLFSPEAKPAAAMAPDAQGFPRLERYPPGSEAQRQLFREAARRYGLPERWADSPALHNLLRSESDGWVGIPNYTYGSRKNDRSQWDNVHRELQAGRITARSSATGLGQLLLANVDRYYPDGRAGIGDPINEAAGMMRYIQDRYGTPENAWRHYNTRHEGY